jgi:hypothetical protein
MRGFMYSRIEEKSVIDLLTQKLDEEWKRANKSSRVNLPDNSSLILLG